MKATSDPVKALDAFMSAFSFSAQQGLVRDLPRHPVHPRTDRGVYRDRWKDPMTIYIDNYAMGNSYEEVDPARFQKNTEIGR
jgi:hypothetical protein